MYKMIADIKNRTKTELRNSETKSATPIQIILMKEKTSCTKRSLTDWWHAFQLKAVD